METSVTSLAALHFPRFTGRRTVFVGDLLLLVSLLGVPPAAGQAWDTSGNGQLNGTYYFREVSYATDESGDIARIDLAIVSLGAPAYVFWRYDAPATEAESVIN